MATSIPLAYLVAALVSITSASTSIGRLVFNRIKEEWRTRRTRKMRRMNKEEFFQETRRASPQTRCPESIVYLGALFFSSCVLPALCHTYEQEGVRGVMLLFPPR